MSRKPVYISRKKQKTETKKVTYYGEAIQKTSSNGLTNCPLGGLLKRTTASQPETVGTRKADWSLPAWNRDLGLKTLIENPRLSADRETSTQGRELLQGRKFLLTPTGPSGICESKHFSCNLSAHKETVKLKSETGSVKSDVPVLKRSYLDERKGEMIQDFCPSMSAAERKTISGKNGTSAKNKPVGKTNSQPRELPSAAMGMPQPMQIDGSNWPHDGAEVLDSELKMEVDIIIKSVTDRSARNIQDHSFREGQNDELSGERNRSAPANDYQLIPERIPQPTEDFEMEKRNVAEELPFIAANPKELAAPSSKKLKTGTLLNFARVIPRLPRNPQAVPPKDGQDNNATQDISHKADVSSTSPQKKISPTKKGCSKLGNHKELDRRNVLCPVPGCKNFNGRGFRRKGISDHLMGQHFFDLKKTSPNYSAVYELLKTLDRNICVTCQRISKRSTE